MLKSRFFLLLVLAFSAFALPLTSCGNDKPQPTVGTKTAGTIDTSQKVPEATIVDTNHHIFFQPKPGSTYRFHVADKITQSVSEEQGGQTHSQNGGTTTEYFIRETVKSVDADSSVLLVMHVDSIAATMTRDTEKIAYSSNHSADRNNRDFLEFNIIVGKDFTVKVNKFGDLNDIPDVSAISAALLATAPDSLRNNPQVRSQATQQAQMVANSYAMRVLGHNPTRRIVKDTTWTNTSEVNLDLARGLSFPVIVNASEHVAAIEQRGNKVIVALEDHTTTKPKKTTFEDAAGKATISDFVATSNSMLRLEDATGVLYHRLVEEKRHFIFTIESKQSPGQKHVLKQSSTGNTVVEQLP